MYLKTLLAPLALLAATAAVAPAAAAPVKATVVYANKTAVVDTDTTFPVRALRTQIEQATGIEAKYMYLQVITPKPALLQEGERTLESYGLYADFRVVARAQNVPNP